MDPDKWARMVEETRILERALGSADKFIADNEIDTAIVQRRCLRAAREIQAGEVFTRDMIDVLRPATVGAIKPDQIRMSLARRMISRAGTCYRSGRSMSVSNADSTSWPSSHRFARLLPRSFMYEQHLCDIAFFTSGSCQSE
jgi:hypothetical protein